MFWENKRSKSELKAAIASLDERLKMLEFVVNHPAKYATGDRVEMGSRQGIVIRSNVIRKNVSGSCIISHIKPMWEYDFFYTELNETQTLAEDQIPPGCGAIVKSK